MEQAFQYDVILSHSAKDKPAVCPVAERLRSNWLKQFPLQPLALSLQPFPLGALPHHNEIAVDEFPKKMAKGDYKIQKLYDPPTYARQFTYRYNTVRDHILQTHQALRLCHALR